MSTFFFFNDTATTEIYTLSLHDALPIFVIEFVEGGNLRDLINIRKKIGNDEALRIFLRSEEHTSELQSPDHLVCRLLLEKKKTTKLYQSATRPTRASTSDTPQRISGITA